MRNGLFLPGELIKLVWFHNATVEIYPWHKPGEGEMICVSVIFREPKELSILERIREFFEEDDWEDDGIAPRENAFEIGFYKPIRELEEDEEEEENDEIL